MSPEGARLRNSFHNVYIFDYSWPKLSTQVFLNASNGISLTSSLTERTQGDIVNNPTITFTFTQTNLPNISEMFVEYLAHKNPVIRAQTGCLLQRSLAITKATVLNKTLLKLLLPPLLKVTAIWRH